MRTILETKEADSRQIRNLISWQQSIEHNAKLYTRPSEEALASLAVSYLELLLEYMEKPNLVSGLNRRME